MQDVWPGLIVSPETVSHRVKLLREALGDDSRMPRYIGRLRGRGYNLVPTAERLSDEGAEISPPPVRLTPPVETIAFEPEPFLDASGELTLLEGPAEVETLKEPDWASPPAIPTQLFAGLLETPAGETQDDLDPADTSESAEMQARRQSIGS
jgi:hypothetical protein